MIDQGLKESFSRQLRKWYQENARDLPWRRTRDPYQIWVSEIMLQQTRVDTVIPYYLRWMEKFPTLQDLARASQDQVLSAWEGLGYYRRASHLHQAVMEVAASYNGQVPDDIKTLQQLPGIGRYTAGAISSIAFNRPAAILDGNIRRVFSRFFNIDQPLNTAASEQALWGIAEELQPAAEPGIHNQALMELGALVCVPANPVCPACPVKDSCRARELGIQDQLPIKKNTSPLPQIQVTAAVIVEKGLVLLAKRPAGGLLGGMWEYPGGKQQPGENLQQTLRREMLEELKAEIQVEDQLGTYQHAYTHYKVTLHAFRCRLLTRDLVMNYHTEIAWIPLDRLAEYPMGKLDRLISNQLLQSRYES